MRLYLEATVLKLMVELRRFPVEDPHHESLQQQIILALRSVIMEHFLVAVNHLSFQRVGMVK